LSKKSDHSSVRHHHYYYTSSNFSRNEYGCESPLWLLNPMMPHLPAVIHAHWRTEKLQSTPHRYRNRYRYICPEEGGLQSSCRSFCMLIVCLICPSFCLCVLCCSWDGYGACAGDCVSVVLCSSFDSFGLFCSLALPLHPADKQIQRHWPCGMPALHSTLMALNYLSHGPAYRTTRNLSPWAAYRRLPSLALLSLDQGNQQVTSKIPNTKSIISCRSFIKCSCVIC